MRTLTACLISFSLVGCGGGVELPELGQVTGKVTNGGAAVSNAVVTFSPTGDGRTSSATTDDEGNYTLMYNADVEGAVLGEHTVSVAAIVGDADYEEADDVGDGEQSANGGLPEGASDGSLVVTVKAGPNVIDIPL